MTELSTRVRQTMEQLQTGAQGTFLIDDVLELCAETERLALELERHQVSGDYEMGQLHAEAAWQTRLRAAGAAWRGLATSPGDG